jgi:tetratricopeptide (TPR) repeat protein
LSGPDQLEFFNRQDAIPDRLRTENARVIAEVRRASLGEQAFLTWRAAWAARHALNRLPEIPLLTGWNRGALKNLALSDAQAALPILQRLSGRTRAGRPANSNPAERLAASILLAGVYDRLGEREAARQELTRLAGESHQRYADSRQDPFWPVVGGRPRAAEKATALDQVRRELEQEIANRQTILEDEYAYLGKAAELLKDALEEAAYPTPGEALFHAYLLADFLRRLDQLPAASEWFKAVLSLSGANANLGEAARAGLEQVTRQAGERVNLLAGIGVDGELIEKLREICKNNPLNPTP